MPWHRTKLALVVSALVFPPAGMVLLWMRQETRVPWKLMGSLAIFALAIAHLFLFYGLRAEMDGTGIRPIFSFYRPEKHYAELERNRAEQRTAAPVTPQPVTAQPVAAVPETEAVSAKEAAAAQPAIGAGRWTAFRGPERDGVYREGPVLASWPAGGLKPLWKQPVGGGYASISIAGGTAFTIEQRRDKEVVAAYDVATGRELWTHSWPGFFQESMGGDGPRTTPTWDDGRLYVLGAQGEFRCLDAATGRRVWSKNILQENNAENLQWGMAASPLIVDDKVIVLPGGRGASVVAYNKMTGEPVWKSLDDKQAYTSPMLVKLAGKRQILAVSGSRAIGVAAEDGKLLWEFPWHTEYDINSAQPIITGENQFFISAGYGHGAALVEISQTGDGFSARPLWQNTSMKNKFNSSVLRDGHIYGLDEGILACVEVRTGQRKWKGGRYGYGQVLLAGDKLIVISESGELALVKASPDSFQELAKFEAIEGKTWNVPALGGGYLLVRNTTEMAAFRIAP